MIKKAQQEIAGFVLIVVLVVIALMVFLIISINGPEEELQDANIENMISVILSSTTECAPNYVPDYDNVEDLISDCWQNRKCGNLNQMACSYLNETLLDIVESLKQTENGINSYYVRVAHVTNESEDLLIPVFSKGNCTGTLRGDSKAISGDLIIELKLCYD
jgi:ABC-type lipoprotein release transport system permease subunit